MKKQEELSISVQMLKNTIEQLSKSTTVFVDESGKEHSIEDAASKGLSGKFVNRKVEMTKQFTDLGFPIQESSFLKLLTEVHNLLNGSSSKKSGGSTGGRKSYSDEEKKTIVEEFKKSDISAFKFAKDKGIGYQTFNKWIK
jgi:hypothetical protein